jgi:hypothetical protein
MINMDEQVISINSDDIVENLDKILDQSSVFKTNSNIDGVNCYIFYLNNNQLHNYKKYEIDTTENKLSKKELLNVVLNNVKQQNKKYDLVGIYKFELNLDHENIKTFCKDQTKFDFITSYKSIQDIYFQHCIEMFNDNNSVILIFSTKSLAQETTAKTNMVKNKTKKNVRFNLKNNTTQGHNKTIRTRT